MLDYIVDFYCHELQLAIEIDGDSHYHEDKYVYDFKRQRSLEYWGVKFLRFDDSDIKQKMNWVLEEIIYCIQSIKRVGQLPE